jgi:hypothetical protein
MFLSFIIMLILQLTTPFWWWIIVVPFMYGFIRSKSAWRAFATGLSSAGLLWFSSAFYMYLNTSEIITRKVALLMSAPSPYFMIAITTAIAMLAGGVACCTGYLVWCAFQEFKQKEEKNA